jgi:NAD(P)-dependent dehydrogenase (short-subunit alcohol dehydrogenase family)
MAQPKKPGMSGHPDRTLTWRPTPLARLDLAGKKAAIVGGTDGLGRALAKALASRGADVIVVGRTFRDEGAARLSFVKADLGSMKEAERVGESLPVDLDLVVLTTGIFAGPMREVTSEGLERDMAVSYLSRLALLRKLAPRLRTSGAPARVFVMGFPGTGELGELGDLNSEKGYASMKVHMSTVAGNEALVLDAVKRYPHLRIYGLNPGLIKTTIRANVLGGTGTFRFRAVEWLIGLFTMSAETYGERTAPLLVAPELEARSGAMFNQKGVAILPSPGMTPEHVAALIAESEALVARAVSRAA